jgi:hypothetical protein
LVVYGAYFAWALTPGHDEIAVCTHMAFTVVALLVLTIALQIAIALNARRLGRDSGQTDERDRLIAARSARNGYFTLMAGLWAMPFVALYDVSPVLMANCLLALTVLGEATQLGSRALYDRMDA